uniref:Fibronectin type-III domain-containing protein n=1 Tax=Denticeps clupeoides TaxID=299321 RepID=A0AAY4AQI8_9TELE
MMKRGVILVLILFSVSGAKRQYFYQQNASSWDSARRHCQICYTDMVTVTADNILLLLQSFSQNTTAVWVGLRRILNDTDIQLSANSSSNTSGLPLFANDKPLWLSRLNRTLPWSRWANGDPVTYQNWYLGRPVPKPKPVEQNSMIMPTLQPTYGSTTDASSVPNFDPTFQTTSGPGQNYTTPDRNITGNDTSVCLRLQNFINCMKDTNLFSTSSPFGTQTSAQMSSITANYTIRQENITDSTKRANISNQTTHPLTFVDSSLVPNFTTSSTSSPTSNSLTSQQTEKSQQTGQIMASTSDRNGQLISNISDPSYSAAYDTAIPSTSNPNLSTTSDPTSQHSTSDQTSSSTSASTFKPSTDPDVVPTLVQITAKSSAPITQNSEPNLKSISDTTFSPVSDPSFSAAYRSTTLPTSDPNLSTTSGPTSQPSTSDLCAQIQKLTQCLSDVPLFSAVSLLSTQTTPPTYKLSTTDNTAGPISSESPDTSSSTFTTSAQTSSNPGAISPTAYYNATNATSTLPDTDEFIADACLVLLAFGMWWERQCSEFLPYICYDERYFGDVSVSNLTQNSSTITWSAAPGGISGYRLELTGDHNLTMELTNLSAQIGNLTAGSLYKVEVFPIKCMRDLSPQNISFYTRPDQLQNLTMSGITETSVSLTWSPPAGSCDLYQIRWILQGGQTYLNGNTTETSYTITNLLPGGYYTFIVSGQVGDNSVPGIPVNVTSYTKPSTVQNLTVVGPQKRTFTASWDPPVGNCYSYNVSVCMWIGSVCVVEFSATQTERLVNIIMLDPGYKVLIMVNALAADGTAGNTVSHEGFTLPDPVSNLQLNVISATVLEAVWNSPMGGYTSFSVTLLNSNLISVSGSNTTQNSSQFQNLKAGVNYTVQVYTVGVGDTSSDIMTSWTFTPPEAPGEISFTSANTTSIQLAWGVPKNSENETIKYQVCWKSAFWSLAGCQSANINFTTVSNLKSGTNYSFYITVQAGNMTSLPSTNSQYTKPNVKVVTLMMLCTSQTGACSSATFQDQVLSNLQQFFLPGLDGVYHTFNKSNGPPSL